MSGGKFASLTGDLLVRKGEAAPSAIVPPRTLLLAPPMFGNRPAAEAKGKEPLPANSAADQREDAERADAKPARRSAPSGGDPPSGGQAEKPRRLMVCLTPAEYETLGLIGVKKGLTRHQLVRNAVDEYLALLVEEYEGECQCIYTGCSC